MKKDEKIILSFTIIIIVIIVAFNWFVFSNFNNDENECKLKCASINESYNYSSTDDENKLICYCKPKLNIVNGIVR